MRKPMAKRTYVDESIFFSSYFCRKLTFILEFDPKSIIIVTDNGRLSCYSLNGIVPKPIRLPPPFIHQDKSITFAKIFPCTQSFLDDIRYLIPLQLSYHFVFFLYSFFL